MKMYKELPAGIESNWASQEVSYPPGSKPVPFHYHEVEEWLQVLNGTMKFFPIREENPNVLKAGDLLNIQPGEAHRVEFGPEEVKYRMWLPEQVADNHFQHPLDDNEVALLRKNLDLAEVENRWDRRPNGTAVGQNADGRFLDNLISPSLIFRGAARKFVGKKAYLGRPPGDFVRTPSNTISILHKGDGYMLISTVVETRKSNTQELASYFNVRLFVREDGLWRCRIWLNFPEN